MKNTIKKLLKKIISNKFIKRYRYASNIYQKNNNSFNIIDKIKCLIFIVPKIKVYSTKKFSKVINKNIIYSKYFAYHINFNSFVLYKNSLNNNMTPDYSVILENSLNDFRKLYKGNKEELEFIDELENYLDKFINCINLSDYENKNTIIEYLQNIKDKKCANFNEALQRILFFNQLFWQMGYTLCGLGRLDYILDKYYNNDKEKYSEQDIKEMIKDFYEVLNHHFEEKSNCLYGDTGQIIILGGLDSNNQNFTNDLTYIFIEALKEYKKPDPKLFLRVNKKTEDKLLKYAIECISTGIGSPLLSNDDVVIPLLNKYGYSKEDTWNYVTAACWEPSPCGNSIDYNNALILNLLEPLNNIFINTNFSSIEEIENEYYKSLKKYIEEEINKISNYKYDEQPYYSLFIKDCREQGKTLSECIPKYKNLGVTTLGISSVVNSILNIKKYVFDKKIITLDELNNERESNFQNKEILDMLKHNNKYGYCSTNKEAILLTNKITELISKEINKYTNYYGGKYKFGLSAPSYVENGMLTHASFDGRKNGESFSTHISSNANTYIEIMDFASKIEYKENCINGNVIDYILNPEYINNNIDKFTTYIKGYILKGFYQMQINVIDSKTLINAKNNPDLYKNLIVRVWGFSSYFNDLPEEYKDLLIERAKNAEGLSGKNAEI